MGEHRLNPVAIANAVPKRDVTYIKLGESHGLLGIGLEPHIDGDGVLRVLLIATCARISTLVPIDEKSIVKVVLGQPAAIKVEELVKQISATLDPPKEELTS